MTANRKLLAMIAAVPAGDKLPIPAFARQSNATQSVIISSIEALIADGLVDGATLRPPVPVPGQLPSRKALYAQLATEGARIGLSPAKVSVEAFGNASQMHSMSRGDGEVRLPTLVKAQAWLDEAAQRPTVAAAERVTGPQLLEEINAFCAAKGWTIYRFERAIAATSLIARLPDTPSPTDQTIARVRSLIAAETRDPSDEPAGLPETKAPPPSLRTQLVEAQSESRRRVDHGRRLVEAAHANRLPGQSIADRVRQLASPFDQDEADQRAADRRHRALIDLPSPSALIQRAQRDWPAQSASVARLATEMGVPKGEAWLRVIQVGVRELTGLETSEGEA